MKEKLGAALMCLVFALPFGGVGVFAFYMAGTMIHDGLRAKEWVRVKAEVQEGNYYRYEFGGRAFRNDRLGTDRTGGTSDVDDFDQRVAERFARAREENTPITVFVNPENPSESMVDREIRWTLALVMMPFAFGFGGVGLGALWVLWKIFSEGGRKKSGATDAGREAVDRATGNLAKGPAGLWVFTFFWNVISVPIALVVVPQAIADGEWVALLVLIFPVVGALLLLAAISATIDHFRPKRRRRRPRASAPSPAPSQPASFAATPVADGDFTRYAQPRTAPAAAAAPSATFDSIEKLFGGHVDLSKMPPEQRAAIERLSPQQKAVVEKVVRFAPNLRKVVIGLVVFIIAVQALPNLIALVWN